MCLARLGVRYDLVLSQQMVLDVLPATVADVAVLDTVKEVLDLPVRLEAAPSGKCCPAHGCQALSMFSSFLNLGVINSTAIGVPSIPIQFRYLS